MMPTKNFVW